MDILLSLILAFAQTFPFPGPRNVALAVPGYTYTGKSCAAQGTPCTWSAAPSVGESIHCIVANQFAAASSFAISDGTANAYTANPGGIVSGVQAASWQAFESLNIANSPTTETLTVTGTSSFPNIFCVSTIGGAGVLDLPGSFANVTSATPAITIAPTGSADFIYCAASNGGTSAPTGVSPGTIVSTTSGNISQSQAVLVASGSQSVTFSYSSSNDTDIFCAADK